MTEKELQAIRSRAPKRDQYGFDVGGPDAVQSLASDHAALLDEVARWRGVRARLAAIVAGDEATEYVLECYDKALEGA